MPCNKCCNDFATGAVIVKCKECKHEFQPACSRDGSSQNFTKTMNKNWQCDSCDINVPLKSSECSAREDRNWFLAAVHGK